MVVDVLWWEDILVVGLVLLFTVVVLSGVKLEGNVVNGQLVVMSVDCLDCLVVLMLMRTEDLRQTRLMAYIHDFSTFY
jgi:hypothetical protein